MTGFKKILAMTTMLALLIAPTASFGATEQGAEEQAPITMMKSELIREGFSQSELSEMSSEIPELHEIVTNNDLTDEQLANLKETFLHIHDVDDSDVVEYEVDENGIVDMGDHKTIVPNVNDESIATRAINPGSSGVHVLTATNQSNRFYKATGYVDLPTVNVKYDPVVVDDVTVNHRSRPYVMFGAYGPGFGFDSGLTYYQETQSWRLFRSFGTSGTWVEKNISLSGNSAYLWMELNGSNSLIKVIDPATWTEVGSLTIPLPSAASMNPYNTAITREVALAQFARADNGDYLKNAHWHDVYYYRSTDGFNTPGTAAYMLSSWQGMIPYDSSMPKYLIGDDQHDKSKVTIRPQSNYFAEWVDIVLN